MWMRSDCCLVSWQSFDKECPQTVPCYNICECHKWTKSALLMTRPMAPNRRREKVSWQLSEAIKGCCRDKLPWVVKSSTRLRWSQLIQTCVWRQPTFGAEVEGQLRRIFVQSEQRLLGYRVPQNPNIPKEMEAKRKVCKTWAEFKRGYCHGTVTYEHRCTRSFFKVIVVISAIWMIRC